jgi:predicted NUDIX family NTP pyrophosphohydrolase
MARESAGLLMFRRRGQIEVLIVHPGGPYWKNKDEGAWTIPKGEPALGEDLLSAARREFQEETGFTVEGCFIELTAVRQKGGKIIRAWAVEGDCDPTQIRSNTFKMEWPPRSGKFAHFPEIDRAAFFPLEEAKQKINPAQVVFIDELARRLRSSGTESNSS